MCQNVCTGNNSNHPEPTRQIISSTAIQSPLGNNSKGPSFISKEEYQNFLPLIWAFPTPPPNPPPRYIFYALHDIWPTLYVQSQSIASVVMYVLLWCNCVVHVCTILYHVSGSLSVFYVKL